MTPRIPERNKQSGVSYAVTDDGLELPVIDVTHPAFAFRLDDDGLSRVIDDTLGELARLRDLPADERRRLVEGSILLRGGMQAAGSYLSAISTYLHKLGPANLGEGYASDFDRRAAGHLLPAAFRLRLQSTARLLAEAVAPRLEARRGPLGLVNVGGGTALDSLNALLLLLRDHPAALAGRAIAVRVLDLDAAGPAFGRRALEALRAPGAPLAGLDATLEHVPYDWADPGPLGAAVASLCAAGEAVVAGSTEGGLFEYGTDEQIVANLRALRERAPSDFVLVGAVLKDKATLPPRLKWIGDSTAIRVRLLGLDALRSLARGAGWEVARVEDGPIHHVVALKMG